MRLPKFYEQAKPREKVLFGLLLAMLAAVGAINFYDYFGLGTQSTAPPPVQALNPVQPVKPTADAVLPAAATTQIPLRDPFSVPPGYQPAEPGSKAAPPASPEPNTTNASNPTNTPASTTAQTPQKSDQPSPVNTGFALRGVLKSGSDKMALVEYNGSSQAVGISENIQGYQVVSIGEDYVKLSGPDGTRVLRLQ